MKLCLSFSIRNHSWWTEIILLKGPLNMFLFYKYLFSLIAIIVINSPSYNFATTIYKILHIRSQLVTNNTSIVLIKDTTVSNKNPDKKAPPTTDQRFELIPIKSKTAPSWKSTDSPHFGSAIIAQRGIPISKPRLMCFYSIGCSKDRLCQCSAAEILFNDICNYLLVGTGHASLQLKRKLSWLEPISRALVSSVVESIEWIYRVDHEFIAREISGLLSPLYLK